jgi:hypothetical protein
MTIVGGCLVPWPGDRGGIHSDDAGAERKNRRDLRHGHVFFDTSQRNEALKSLNERFRKCAACAMHQYRLPVAVTLVKMSLLECESQFVEYRDSGEGD